VPPQCAEHTHKMNFILHEILLALNIHSTPRSSNSGLWKKATQKNNSKTVFWKRAVIWPSGQSGGLAPWRSRFDPRQGRPLNIWMYTPSAVSTFRWICALYKSSYFISFHFNTLKTLTSHKQLKEIEKCKLQHQFYINFSFYHLDEALRAKYCGMCLPTSWIFTF
jgi:hypothetical protein